MTEFSYRYPSTSKYLCCFLFQCRGSIWGEVLPYCLLNCGIMAAIEWLAVHDYKIAFPIQGHTLMTLIISYLVVAKINLSYERYMKARYSIGNALSSLRELNQLTLSYTYPFQYLDQNNQSSESKKNASTESLPSCNLVKQWRVDLTERIVDLMDCTIRVIRNEEQSKYLARYEHEECHNRDDPLSHVQALRLHLCHGSAASHLQVMERMKLMDMLNDYALSYRQLLVLASTPLPYPLVQMARTFLFLWTFTIPFVLRGVVDEAAVAMGFVFFLTYGFVGLELVSLRLVHPFGDGISDLNITGMREATIHGIERDLELFGEQKSLGLGDRRLEFSRQKACSPKLNVFNQYVDGPTIISSLADEGVTGSHPTDHMYIAMHAV